MRVEPKLPVYYCVSRLGDVIGVLVTRRAAVDRNELASTAPSYRLGAVDSQSPPWLFRALSAAVVCLSVRLSPLSPVTYTSGDGHQPLRVRQICPTTSARFYSAVEMLSAMRPSALPPPPRSRDRPASGAPSRLIVSARAAE